LETTASKLVRFLSEPFFKKKLMFLCTDNCVQNALESMKQHVCVCRVFLFQLIFVVGCWKSRTRGWVRNSLGRGRKRGEKLLLVLIVAFQSRFPCWWERKRFTRSSTDTSAHRILKLPPFCRLSLRCVSSETDLS